MLGEHIPASNLPTYLNVSEATLQKLLRHALFPKPIECWGYYVKADIDNFLRQTHDTDLTWLANSIEPDRPRPIRRPTVTLSESELLRDDTIDEPRSWLTDEADLNDEDLHDQANRWLAEHGDTDDE